MATENSNENAENADFHQQYGLEWTGELYELEPRWTVEPSLAIIETLSRKVLDLPTDAQCTVSFHAEGEFNKLYAIETDSFRKWIMRVALSVDPCRKTESEVATMQFALHKIGTTVPSVLAHDASNRNALGFEWIFMEYKHGRTLEEAWRTLLMTKKETLAKTLAVYQSELYTEKFSMIGNLYHGNDAASYKLGSMVAMMFFWGDRGSRDAPRGPFRNSHAWLSARLDLLLYDQERIITTMQDEEVVEDAEFAKSLAKQLTTILPTIFPEDEEETTTLFHDDVHAKNLLVDEDGCLTAILDWECVSAVPTWMACQPPALLLGGVREEMPQKEHYVSGDSELPEGTLWWEHLLEYERGQLHQLFLSEMKLLQPDWYRQYEEGKLKRDFELAVRYSDDAFSKKRIQTWLDAYSAGEPISLVELIVS